MGLKKFETKMTMMGGSDDLAKGARVLNRIVRWHPRRGITCKADSRHAEIISRNRRRESQDHTDASRDRCGETEDEKRQDVNVRPTMITAATH